MNHKQLIKYTHALCMWENATEGARFVFDVVVEVVGITLDRAPY